MTHPTTFRATPRRRLLPFLLLSCWLLQGCYRTTPMDGPEPGQRIGGVVLRSGEEVLWPASYEGTLEDSVVVVRRLRDASLVRTIPAEDVTHVLERELRVGATIAVVSVAVIGVVAIIALLIGNSAEEAAGEICWVNVCS